MGKNDLAWQLERRFREEWRAVHLEKLEELGPTGEEALKRILSYDTEWFLEPPHGEGEYVRVSVVGIEEKRQCREDGMILYQLPEMVELNDAIITNAEVVRWAKRKQMR